MTHSKKTSGRKSKAADHSKKAADETKDQAAENSVENQAADNQAQNNQAKDSPATGSGADGQTNTAETTAAAKTDDAAASTGKTSAQTDAADTKASASSADKKSRATRKKADKRDTPAADTPSEPPAVVASTAVAEYKPSKAPIIIAVLALILAFGAVIAAVWIWMWSTARVHESELAATRFAQQATDVGKRGERNESRIDGFETAVIDMRSNVQNMALKVEDTNNDVTRFQADVEAARADLKAGNAQLTELVEASNKESAAARERMVVLEKNLKQLRAHIGDSRGQWMVAEVEYLLIVAGQRLDLLGDTATALVALEEADKRLEQLADPAYLPVRRALNNEIKALEAYQAPKVAKAALVLSSLANNAHQYKAKGEGNIADLAKREIKPEGEEPAPKAKTEEDSDNEPGWIDAIGEELSGLYQVSYYNTEGYEPPLTADRSYFLKQNLQIKLDAAKLALLRDNPAMYIDALDQASLWVAEHFDAEDPNVKQLRADLLLLKQSPIQAELPTISGSYDVLKRVKASIATQRDQEEAP